MKRWIIGLLLWTVTGCGEGVEGTESKAAAAISSPEIIMVDEKISGGEVYNVDLRREDAVFYISIDVREDQITITCPAGPLMTFKDYLKARVWPTGSDYTPGKHGLWVGNEVLEKFLFTGTPQVDTSVDNWGCSEPEAGAENCIPLQES